MFGSRLIAPIKIFGNICNYFCRSIVNHFSATKEKNMIHFAKIALSSLMLLSSLAAPTVSGAAAYRENVASVNEMEVIYVPYISKQRKLYYDLALEYPDFTYAPPEGSCANTAGGNLLAYYDRMDENLIPNHVSGYPFNTSYVYYMEDAGAEAAIDLLTKYMKTTSAGTTEANFKSGMQRYCKEKGKSILFSSCMESGKLNYYTCLDYIQNNQPIVLFLEGFNVGHIYTGENEDSISYYVSPENHVMVAFGYDVYVYNTSDGTITYNFLEVSSGIKGCMNGLFNINYNTIIDDALAVLIY